MSYPVAPSAEEWLHCGRLTCGPLWPLNVPSPVRHLLPHGSMGVSLHPRSGWQVESELVLRSSGQGRPRR